VPPLKPVTPVPDIDAFEERAAIIQHDGGLSRSSAENMAAKAQGFRDASHYWQVLADYVVSKKLG
jgi:hypothetical protein